MAASVLAIGLNMEPAQSLPLGAAGASQDAAAAVLKAQQKEISPAPGQGQGGAGQGTPGQGPGQGQGMKAPRQGGPGMGPGMGGPGMGGGGMRGQGPQFRSGQQGGAHGFGPGERSRERIGRERERGHMRRHFGRRGWEGGSSYGYLGSDCGWLRRRALATGSGYWWRRYRECLY
jgi:hypothetical protein